MKLSTSDLDAFTSPNLPPLLTMGINIEGISSLFVGLLTNFKQMLCTLFNFTALYYRVSTPAGEAMKNEPFSEFGWKSWKTIGFSPASAGKA